jgi:hypothetical protein
MERKVHMAAGGAEALAQAQQVLPEVILLDRSETFQFSTDPYFVEKARDIAGVCMSPP